MSRTARARTTGRLTACGRMRSPYAVGFTVVELMVAMSVMAIALLGVYSIVKQVLEVEARATVQWNHVASADSVAQYVVDLLTSCVNLPDRETVMGGPDSGDNTYVLTCFTESTRGSFSLTPEASLRRYRLQWGFEDEDRAGCLEVKAMSYCGTVNVTACDGQAWDGPEDDDGLWDRIPADVVARRIDDLSVSYRPADDPDAVWADSWSGPVGNIAVRVMVRVGNQTVQRKIVPQVNAAVVGEGI